MEKDTNNADGSATFRLTEEVLLPLQNEAKFVDDCMEQIDQIIKDNGDTAEAIGAVFGGDKLSMARFSAAQRNFPAVIIVLVDLVKRLGVMSLTTCGTHGATHAETTEPLTRDEIDQIKAYGGLCFRCGPITKTK